MPASLSVTPGRQAVLFHCFAGCTQSAIMAAGFAAQPKSAPAMLLMPSPRDLTPLITDIWGMARPVARTIAERYLKRRGIGHSFAGRFTPSAVTYENGRKLRLPALLLPMTEGRDLRAAADIPRPRWPEGALP
jgi:hypothetical protein